MLHMLGFIQRSSATAFKLVAIQILFKEPRLFSMAKQRQAQIFQILNVMVRAGPSEYWVFRTHWVGARSRGFPKWALPDIYLFYAIGFDHNSNTWTTLVILLWYFFWKPSTGCSLILKISKNPKLSIITKLKNGPIEVRTYTMQYIQDIAPMGPYTGSGRQHLL